MSIDISYISFNNEFKSFLIEFETTFTNSKLSFYAYLVKVHEKQTVLNKHYAQNVDSDILYVIPYLPASDNDEYLKIFKVLIFDFKLDLVLENQVRDIYKTRECLCLEALSLAQELIESSSLEFIASTYESSSYEIWTLIRANEVYYLFFLHFSPNKSRKYDVIKKDDIFTLVKELNIFNFQEMLKVVKYKID